MTKPSYDYEFDATEENNTVAAIYAMVLEGGKRVLDLGSGPGIVASHLAQANGRDVTCLDMDPDYLSVAAERGVTRTIESDLDDTPWVEHLAGESFDVIVLADVLEHLRHPEEVLRLISERKLLASNGFVVVSIPNAAHESVIAELLTGNFEYRPTGLLDHTHVRFFTLDSFEAMCEANGYRVVVTRRTTRTIEQTHQKARAFEVPSELRRAMRELNPDVAVYQYVLKLIPTDQDDTHARLRARIEGLEAKLVDQRGVVEGSEAAAAAQAKEAAAAAAQANEAANQLHALQQRIDKLVEERQAALAAAERAERRARSSEADGRELRDRNSALEQRILEWERLVRGQRKALDDQRSGQLARITEAERRTSAIKEKLLEVEGQLRAATREAKATARRLDQVYESFTWKAGRVVKATMGPALSLRRLARRSGPTPAPAPALEPQQAGHSVPAQGSPARPARLQVGEDRNMRAAYEEAVHKRRFSNDGRTRLAVAVYTLDFDEGRGDIYVAVGLGRYLERIDYDVIYLPKEHWYDSPPGTDIYFALLSGVDPSRSPEGALKVGWVRNETENWVENPALNWYDLVLVSSQHSLDRVTTAYSGPTGVLPIGVDLELFRPGNAGSREAVVSTVNQWGRERDLYSALQSRPVQVPLALFGQTRGLAPELAPYAQGPVSFFSLPSIYRQSSLVLDDFNHTTVGYGNVNSRVFEALASGALPVTNSRLGLAPLGLEGVPTYTTPTELEQTSTDLHSDEKARNRLVDRLSEVVRREHSFERRAEQFHQLVAVRALAPAETRRGLVAFFPDYRMTNPFQSMLYAPLREELVSTPVRDILDLGEVELAANRDVVLHIHWTAPILGPATSSTHALQRLQRFVRQLDRATEHGVRIVWTVHNVMPHETSFPDLERTLRQELAERADLVHVMCEKALDEIGDAYVVPKDKVRVIPHGSYVGVYPDVVAPELARRRLGFNEEDTVLLFLGGIRPYKGLDLLLDAFERAVEREPSLRLVVAGRPGRFPGVVELERRASSHPRVHANFNPIADVDLQHFFKACDVVVLPYRSVLSSGSVLLAFTFGRPVIAPRLGCLPDVEEEGLGLSYRNLENVEELADRLAGAPTLKSREIQLAARRRAEAYTSLDMARDFSLLLAELDGLPGE